MQKYLYLTRAEWAVTWVNGGTVPINLASTYKSIERIGTKTPDENLIHEAQRPIPEYDNYGIEIKECKDITINNITYNGKSIPPIQNANYYTEDGIILSFCNCFSICIADWLSKKACVMIKDVNLFKAEIDRQLNSIGIMKDCTYTPDHQRNHFLKSTADAWQNEFRIFWEIKENKEVTIPAGTAELIWSK